MDTKPLGSASSNPIDEAIKKKLYITTGLLPKHAASIQKIINETNFGAIVRTTPAALPLIEMQHPTKGLECSAKVANWGPHEGLVPVNELRYGRIDNSLYAGSFKQQTLPIVPLKLPLTLLNFREKEGTINLKEINPTTYKITKPTSKHWPPGITEFYAVQNNEEDVFTIGKYTNERFEPLKVYAPEKNGLPYTSDFDLFALLIPKNAGTAHEKTIFHKTFGYTTEKEIKFIKKLNEALDQELFKHGSESYNPNKLGAYTLSDSCFIYFSPNKNSRFLNGKNIFTTISELESEWRFAKHPSWDLKMQGKGSPSTPPPIKPTRSATSSPILSIPSSATSSSNKNSLRKAKSTIFGQSPLKTGRKRSGSLPSEEQNGSSYQP